MSNLEGLGGASMLLDELVNFFKLLHAIVVLFTSSIRLPMLSDELYEGVFNLRDDCG